jgi:hypothetical protein
MAFDDGDSMLESRGMDVILHVLYCTVLYCTVLYCTVLVLLHKYFTARCSILCLCNPRKEGYKVRW